MKHSRLIILGSGPAGYTAALYASRANLKPTLISGFLVGGQLTTTSLVDNWPATHEGIMGPDLMDNFLKHVKKFGTEIITDEVTSVDFSQRPFLLKSSKETYTCDALIIATGANAKYLNLPSEQAYLGKGVSACATCDGFFYNNQRVCVVGGGNTALEEALYLSNIASKVYLIHRRDKFKAEAIMVDKLMEKVELGKIELRTFCTLEEVLGNDVEVKAVVIKNSKTNNLEKIDLEGCFIAIGHEPNTKIFLNQLVMRNGYILNMLNGGQTNEQKLLTMTNVAGVFAAGDVQDEIYKQAVTSAGFGCMAALDAQAFLSKEGF